MFIRKLAFLFAALAMPLSAQSVKSIKLTLDSSTIHVGSTTKARITEYLANGTVTTAKAVSWSSADPTIATVAITTAGNSKIATVTASKAGNVAIVAYVQNLQASLVVTIAAPVAVDTVARVVVSPTTATLPLGSSVQLSATALSAAGTVLSGASNTWSSSNTATVTVSATGLATARAVGAATVIATSGSVSGASTITTRDTVTPPPVDTTFHTFAASSFVDSTIAPFWNPYAGVTFPVNVIPDPTNSGHGKVLQFHYENFPEGGNFDDNIAIETDASNPLTHATNGDEVIFEGDFYFPRSALTDTINLNGLRKLNYWCSAEGPSHACLVLTAQPSWPAGFPLPAGQPVPLPQLEAGIAIPGLACDCTYFGGGIAMDTWHHLLVDMRLNSINSVKDGKLRIVLDGVTLMDRSDFPFVDPASTVPIDWYDWRIGEQVNSGHKVAEDRYWDNLVFRVKRAPTTSALRRPTAKPAQAIKVKKPEMH